MELNRRPLLGRHLRDGFLAFGGIADILEIRYKDRD